MPSDEKIRHAGRLRAQGLGLEVIAIRLGVSKGQASKLIKLAAALTDYQAQ